MDKYQKRGVSSTKEDVHNAIKNINKGLFPGAFCKIIPDYLGNDESYCNIMHADGAGTKSSLAYIYYKETGDISVFKGIAMDSIVMNIDDLLCAGCIDDIILSSTIGRNSRFISGEIIKTIIQANEEITQWFTRLGINMHLTGGETADVGDLVKTLIVDTTAASRMKKKDVIDNNNIKPGMMIIGLSSSGKAHYENEYNSGIGSNGLTSARHDVFNKFYKEKYPESYDIGLIDDLTYTGPYLMTDTDKRLPVSIGKAVLSPTRTYAPVIKDILQEYRNQIGGIVHCSGGGQTKCLKFGNSILYVKEKLFEIPPIFQIIKNASNTSYDEMYRVFNMGHRMELYVPENIALNIIKIAENYGIDAGIIGHTEKSEHNKLLITSPDGVIEYV
jgi:phosphoribosylformylglycinamidine cyclo-ligase